MQIKMEFTVTKEQILEFANWGNPDNKKKLKEWFPKAFELQLEVGKWYKNSNGTIVNYQGGKSAYGLSCGWYWYDNDRWGVFSTELWSPATPEEVEAALIAEAKKRGYKKGAIVKSFVCGNTLIGSNNDTWVFRADSNVLAYRGAWVFKDGQWAEILPEEKTIITHEKALKIIAKKLKVSPDQIEIQ